MSGKRSAPSPRRPRLGQHFLRDPWTVDRILEALPADALPVLEIGPGQGVLTAPLVERLGRALVAVELDDRLVARLQARFAGRDGCAILHADILDVRARAALAAIGRAPPYGLVGNLPYAITSLVFRRFLSEEPDPPDWMVVMVQREVAQQIVAAPGRRSLLSISAQYYAEAELLFTVKPEAFAPPPRVHSAVLRLLRRGAPPVESPGPSRFFEVLRAGFSAPRKQLHNTLAQGIWMPEGEARLWIERCEIDPVRRPGTLTLEEWARLAWDRERSGAPPPPALRERPA